MDQVKEAFQKVKQDMVLLRNDFDLLKFELEEVNRSLFEIRDFLHNLNKEKEERISEKKPEKTQEETTTDPLLDSTDQQIIKTDYANTPAHNSVYNPLKAQISYSSTGNEGVPTDRQTDQQTDRHINLPTSELQNPINDAAKILDSLDSLKKEIRLKFKRLTEREMILFSAIYQLEEQEGHADYKMLAQKLNLTESSIRDYVGRLISKGIPVEKKKINNKTIHLKISDSLKRVASLSTILQLVNV